MIWLPSIWFGQRPAQAGTGIVYDFSNMEAPVHTRVIEVLESALATETPIVPVWADRGGSPTNEDQIVVVNMGSEWRKSLAGSERRSTMIHVIAYSATSDGAERLIDKVARIMQSTTLLTFESAGEGQGGVIDTGDAFFRVFEAKVRAGT